MASNAAIIGRSVFDVRRFRGPSSQSFHETALMHQRCHLFRRERMIVELHFINLTIPLGAVDDVSANSKRGLPEVTLILSLRFVEPVKPRPNTCIDSQSKPVANNGRRVGNRGPH